jgi:hypothetical protein
MRRVLRAARRPAFGQMWDAENIPDNQSGMAEHELLTAERNAALGEAFLDLPRPASSYSPCSSKILRVSYAQISDTLGIRSATSGPAVAAARTNCATTRPSPP